MNLDRLMSLLSWQTIAEKSWTIADVGKLSRTWENVRGRGKCSRTWETIVGAFSRTRVNVRESLRSSGKYTLTAELITPYGVEGKRQDISRQVKQLCLFGIFL
jgi:hypothetical protein